MKAVFSSRLAYAALFILAAAAAFAKTLYYARVLQPAGFGVVTLALLTTALGAYFAGFGILEGLAREVPYRRGANQDTSSLRSEALSVITFLAGAFGAGLTVFGVLLAAHRPEFAAFLWSGPLLAVSVVLGGLLCDLQIREYLIAYAGMLVLKSVLAIMFAYSLASHYGASGVLIGEILAAVTCAITCLLCWSADLKWSLRYRESVAGLARLGLPFTVNSLMQNFALSIDRWAVQFAFGVATLGTYSFAMYFTSVGQVLLNMIHLYATPRVLRRYGANEDRKTMLRYLGRIAGGTAVVLAAGVLPFVLVFQYLVTTWYPEYVGAAALAVWVYVGTAAMTLAFFDIVFRALGNGRPLVVIQVCTTTAIIAAYVVAYLAQWPLIAYAAIFAVARFGASAIGWVVALRCCTVIGKPDSSRSVV